MCEQWMSNAVAVLEGTIDSLSEIKKIPICSVFLDHLCAN
jgi:hypothetical protein